MLTRNAALSAIAFSIAIGFITGAEIAERHIVSQCQKSGQFAIGDRVYVCTEAVK